MGKPSRDKGMRFEREIVNRFNEQPGSTALRIPLSGSAEGFKGDVKLGLEVSGIHNWTGECKSRARGFKFLYDNLSDHECLFVKADRKEPLMVIPLSKFMELLR